jgi:hypothetical protein
MSLRSERSIGGLVVSKTGTTTQAGVAYGHSIRHSAILVAVSGSSALAKDKE